MEALQPKPADRRKWEYSCIWQLLLFRPPQVIQTPATAGGVLALSPTHQLLSSRATSSWSQMCHFVRSNHSTIHNPDLCLSLPFSPLTWAKLTVSTVTETIPAGSDQPAETWLIKAIQEGGNPSQVAQALSPLKAHLFFDRSKLYPRGCPHCCDAQDWACTPNQAPCGYCQCLLMSCA